MDCCRIYTDSETSDASEDDTPDADVFDAFRDRNKTRTSATTRSKTTKTPKPSKPARKKAPEEDPSGVKAFEGMVKKIENEILKSYSMSSLKDQDEDKEEALSKVEAEKEEIVLVVQSEDRNRVKIRTTATTPFRSVFDKYKQHIMEKGVITNETEFVFLLEGEPVQPTDLPIQFDCETDDIIDVFIKRTSS